MHRADPKILEVFQALADSHRLRIVTLMLLSKAEVCLCDLSETMDEPEYKLSRHLKVLKNAGLISSFRSGKWIYHSLVKDRSLKGTYDSIKNSPEFKDSTSISYLKKLRKRKAILKDRNCNGLTKRALDSKLR
ncbi:MAG: ArsR/SmtB family transcription factor [Bdellovibrionales bacterium]